MPLNSLHWIVFTNKGIVVISSQCVKKSLKTFHVTKSDFTNSITFTMINQYDKGALIKIESVFQPFYHVAFRGVLSNRSF